MLPQKSNSDQMSEGGYKGHLGQSQIVFSTNNIEVDDPNMPVFKGCLVKRNWYGNKQLREFHLYSSGEIIYYAINKNQK